MALDFYDAAVHVSSPSGDLVNLTALTYMVWVNLDSADKTTGFIVHNYGTSGYRKTLGLLTSGPDTYVTMFVDYDGTDAMATAVLPSLGSWHHMCGRWSVSENSGRCDVFIDGTNVNYLSIIPSGSPKSDGGTLTLGALPGMFLNGMDGKLADAAIFDRRLAEDEIHCVAAGALRAAHLDPSFHVTLEGTAGTAAVGDIGLRDTTGAGNHIDGIVGAPAYYRDPPLHWPIGPEVVPSTARATQNSRPTMNVATGTKLATMRRAV